MKQIKSIDWSMEKDSKLTYSMHGEASFRFRFGVRFRFSSAQLQQSLRVRRGGAISRKSLVDFVRFQQEQYSYRQLLV